MPIPTAIALKARKTERRRLTQKELEDLEQNMNLPKLDEKSGRHYFTTYLDAEAVEAYLEEMKGFDVVATKHPATLITEVTIRW